MVRQSSAGVGFSLCGDRPPISSERLSGERRSVGKDDNGDHRYERLITFKPLSKVEPVPERVSRLYTSGDRF